VPGVFGGDLAAPVLFSVFQRLGRPTPLPPPPAATLIVATDALPQPLRRFGGPSDPVADAPRIAFPPDGAVVEGAVLTVRVADGIAPFTWLADGAPVATTHRREVALDTLGPGFAALTVIDADGRSARAAVEMRR